jgi:hypothetical protein
MVNLCSSTLSYCPDTSQKYLLFEPAFRNWVLQAVQLPVSRHVTEIIEQVTSLPILALLSVLKFELPSYLYDSRVLKYLERARAADITEIRIAAAAAEVNLTDKQVNYDSDSLF